MAAAAAYSNDGDDVKKNTNCKIRLRPRYFLFVRLLIIFLVNRPLEEGSCVCCLEIMMILMIMMSLVSESIWLLSTLNNKYANDYCYILCVEFKKLLLY